MRSCSSTGDCADLLKEKVTERMGEQIQCMVGSIQDMDLKWDDTGMRWYKELGHSGGLPQAGGVEWAYSSSGTRWYKAGFIIFCC